MSLNNELITHAVGYNDQLILKGLGRDHINLLLSLLEPNKKMDLYTAALEEGQTLLDLAVYLQDLDLVKEELQNCGEENRLHLIIKPDPNGECLLLKALISAIEAQSAAIVHTLLNALPESDRLRAITIKTHNDMSLIEAILQPDNNNNKIRFEIIAALLTSLSESDLLKVRMMHAEKPHESKVIDFTLLQVNSTLIANNNNESTQLPISEKELQQKIIEILTTLRTKKSPRLFATPETGELANIAHEIIDAVKTLPNPKAEKMRELITEGFAMALHCIQQDSHDNNNSSTERIFFEKINLCNQLIIRAQSHKENRNSMSFNQPTRNSNITTPSATTHAAF